MSKVRRRRRANAILAPLGLWLEPATSNITPKNIDYSTWGKSLPSIIINSGLALGASTYGTELKQGADGGQVALTSTGVSAAFTGGFMCGSVLWKRGSSLPTGNQQLNRFATTPTAWLDFRWGTNADGSPDGLVLSGNTVAGGFYPVPSLGPGWYRIWGYTNSGPTVATNVQTIVQMGDNVTVGQSAYFVLPQIENSKFPTSPIPNTTAGIVSRIREDFREGDRGALLNTEGLFVEDSIWLARNSNVTFNLFASICGPAYPAAASGNDAGAYIDIATDRIAGQFGNSSAVSTAGAGNNRTDVVTTRNIKAFRWLTSSQWKLFIAGQLKVSNTPGGTVGTIMRAFGSANFDGQAPTIIYQLATYNVDPGSDAAVQAIIPGELSSINRTALLDFRSGTAPANFARSGTALNEDLSIAAINTPRFARYGL